MQLYIKQRVFSWTDSYDVYDENGDRRYFVKAEFLALGHQIHVCDAAGEVGAIHQRLFRLLPEFAISIGGREVGSVRREFSLLRPRYEVDYFGWEVEGDFLGWDYDVTDRNGRTAAHISRQLFSWGDAYVIDIADPADELPGLMLVIAIDAANCSQNR